MYSECKIFDEQLSATEVYKLDRLELISDYFLRVMRRGTKTRADSDTPDLTNMNHTNESGDSVNTGMLDEGATSISSGTSHSKSGKHDDSKKERVVKVALPGAKKAQSAAKKKKSTPDLVRCGQKHFVMLAKFCILLRERECI